MILLGAISVHGVCGMFGTLAVGFFALNGGLFYGGGTALLAVQVTGIVAIMAWALIIGFAVLKLLER